MLRKFSWSKLLIPLALLLQVLVLAGITILLQAGNGPLKNNLPSWSNYFVVLIDTDQYSTEVNGQTYHGLPDSHDFSRTKDFFAIFPTLYCSGWKRDGKYGVDYASSWGRQFFDLYRLWRVWGVDLMEKNLIGETPKLIFIGMLTFALATVLTIVAGIAAVCSFWFSIAAAALSWITFIAALATGALSLSFQSRVKNAEPTYQGGSGKITFTTGGMYARTIGAVTAISFFTAVLWTFICIRQRKARKGNGGGKKSNGMGQSREMPIIGLVRRATGGFLGGSGDRNGGSFKPLHLGQEMTGSQVDLVSRSRAGSRTGSHAGSNAGSRSVSREHSPSGEVLYDRGRIPRGDTAYEPMRHRELPG